MLVTSSRKCNQAYRFGLTVIPAACNLNPWAISSVQTDFFILPSDSEHRLLLQLAQISRLAAFCKVSYSRHPRHPAGWLIQHIAVRRFTYPQHALSSS